MNSRDQPSARYFNQARITLRLDASVDDEQFDLMNDVEMLARLTGAPDNSEIHVSRGFAAVDSLILRVRNASIFQYPSEYALFNEDEGGRVALKLLVDSIYVRKELQGTGIGTRSVMISLAEAKALKLHSVALEAAGSSKNRTFFGYQVWPSMGFDAPLSTEKTRLLPVPLADAKFLSDLMQSEEGEQWWYDNGGSLEVEFDLRDNSISWQLLNSYARRKGIRI
jgi:GNAT superfamily N-acetyltransferase